MLNTFATLCVAAVAVTVIGLMITSRVRMTELDSVINERNQQLTVLQSEHTRLTDELQRKVSTESVEDYAENVLGMQKLEAYQVEYIRVESGDKMVVADEGNDSILGTIGSAVSNFFSQLAYLFE